MLRFLSLLAVGGLLAGCLAEVGESGDEDLDVHVDVGEDSAELVVNDAHQGAEKAPGRSEVETGEWRTGSLAMKMGGDVEDPEPTPWRPNGPDDDDDHTTTSSKGTGTNSDE